jgi:hypothetical protein
MNIYFVTSLPRTGTTSLCKMADICGLKSIHVLKNISFIDAINQGYSFFADTPFYSPEFILGLLEYGIQNKYNIKFIHSHRDQESHKVSINKLFKQWKPPPPTKIYNKISLLNCLCYSKIDQNYIKNQYNYIKKISSYYNIDILDYSFNKGWKDFCNFIEKPIPNTKLPHKNKL